MRVGTPSCTWRFAAVQQTTVGMMGISSRVAKEVIVVPMSSRNEGRNGITKLALLGL